MKKRIICFTIVIIIILGEFFYLKTMIKNTSDEIATQRSEIVFLKSKISELEKNKTSSDSDNISPISDPNKKITYSTFSSIKADFTFEYPDTWIYDEKEDPYNAKSTDWGFYTDSEKNPESLVLAVVSPLTESVDFCSQSYIDKNSYQLNVYPTNDTTTFITYEQCGGDYGSAYIYWQKGKRFESVEDVKEIQKVNLIKSFYGTENIGNIEIVKHIAQSIRVK